MRFGHALVFSISITAYKFSATHGVTLEKPYRLRSGMSTAILSAVQRMSVVMSMTTSSRAAPSRSQREAIERDIGLVLVCGKTKGEGDEDDEDGTDEEDDVSIY